MKEDGVFKSVGAGSHDSESARWKSGEKSVWVGGFDLSWL